ncbi:MAG: ribonuclease III [Bacteroidales bacterium]|nr:ribonuclease III [Bacteroidales bacterium]
MHSDKEFYCFLHRELGIRPGKISLYELAFLHKSASIEHGDGLLINNERLEYLGDAILDAIIAEYLFKKFPGKREGFLTQIRSKIVQRSHLEEVAYKMGLDRAMVANTRIDHQKRRIFGDALEALIGAIYLDKGYEKTRHYVIRHILKEYVDLMNLIETETDFKSRLIEQAQKNKIFIKFDSAGANHEKNYSSMFRTNIWIGEKLLGEGFGKSKKEAEQHASEIALSNLSKSSWEKESST